MNIYEANCVTSTCTEYFLHQKGDELYITVIIIGNKNGNPSSILDMGDRFCFYSNRKDMNLSLLPTHLWVNSRVDCVWCDNQSRKRKSNFKPLYATWKIELVVHHQPYKYRCICSHSSSVSTSLLRVYGLAYKLHHCQSGMSLLHIEPCNFSFVWHNLKECRKWIPSYFYSSIQQVLLILLGWLMRWEVSGCTATVL